MNAIAPISMLRTVERRLRRKLERSLSLDHVKYQGLHLPPGYLRSCGHRFRDDKHFVDTARNEARRLVKDFGLQQTSTILDIGCGAGRLPIGLIANEVKLGQYSGLDINSAAIEWCRNYITKRFPNFSFHVTHAAHKKYNPNGEPVNETFALPFGDQSFDLIYLGGVFAVMIPNDVFIYCKEISRLLKVGGKVYLTAFIEENVPDFEENPDNYKMKSTGPLTIARYSREKFFSIVQDAGLAVELFEHGTDIDGQSVVCLRRA